MPKPVAPAHAAPMFVAAENPFPISAILSEKNWSSEFVFKESL
jgi:hypothetical protein